MTEEDQRTLDSPNRLAHVLDFPRRDIERIADAAPMFYRPYKLLRDGREPRPIDNPVDPLKELQKRIHSRLLSSFPFPPVLHGSVKGRSPTTNAQLHVGRSIVVTLDVKACYPSITNAMVFDLFLRRLDFSPTVAHILTELTTYQGHLPQGAPTSPSIANLILLPAVTKAEAIVTTQRLHMGQFVDDTGLSGKSLHSDIITQVCSQFSRIGLRIGRKKISIMRAGAQQIVTGHTVNAKVGIPKQQRSRIRSAVLEAEHMNPGTDDFSRVLNSADARVRRLAKFHPGQATSLQVRLFRLRQKAMSIVPK